MNTDPMIQISPTTPHAHEATRPALRVESFGQTDVGRVQTTNQDQFLIATLAHAFRVTQASTAREGVMFADDQGHLFMVADGMGGAAGGAQASAIAVGAVEGFLVSALGWLCALGTDEQARVVAQLRAALAQANVRLLEEAELHPELAGMGTTLTMAYSFGSDLFVAHAGDSRCYLLRGGALHQVTKDHTVVQRLVDRGLIGEETAKHHGYRHVVENVLGGGVPGLRVDVHRADLAAGDVLLLCSDGLTEMITNEGIATILGQAKTPQLACERLLTRANELGGNDNVTAVVAHYSLP